MSYNAVDFGRLKSPSDPLIPFLTEPIEFTTSQVLLSALQKYGMLIKGYRIVNNDAVNNCTLRTKSPFAPLDTIEPSVEASNQEWTDYFELNPNAVTGSGMIELQLVRKEDAFQR